MKPSTSILSIAAIVLAGTIASSSAQNATTDPVGFITMNITAGTGAAKKISLISAPLLDVASINGSVTGSLTGVTSTTLSCTSANWTAGALSQAATPFLIQIKAERAPRNGLSAAYSAYPAILPEDFLSSKCFKIVTNQPSLTVQPPRCGRCIAPFQSKPPKTLLNCSNEISFFGKKIVDLQMLVG